LFSLLRQAAFDDQKREIAKDVIDAWVLAGGNNPSSKSLRFDDAISLLTKILQSGINLRFIIDALDECDDYYGLLKALRDAAAEAAHKPRPGITPGRLELLVCSRQVVEVLKYMGSAIPIEINDTKDDYDMEVYIITEIRDREKNERLLEGKNPDLEDKLIEILHQRAGGM